MDDAVARVLALYARQTGELAELVRLLPPQTLGPEGAVRGWVHHLADTAIVGAYRARAVAAEQDPLLVACDFDVWLAALGYGARNVGRALDLYRSAREATLELLRALPDGAWARRGRHEKLGELTLLELLRQQCDDTDSHLADIRALVPADLDAVGGRVHAAVLGGIVENGRAPSLAAIATRVGVHPTEVEAALRRLHDGHGLLLHPGSAEVWIAHPFALSPSAAWVASERGGWWAPCSWCAMGIVALAAPSATIHLRLGGEAEAVAIRVRDGRLVDDDLVVHFALPPRDAWSNVVHWCATVLPFRSEAEVDDWCARHALPRGAVVPIARVLELGRAWYGRHLDEDWKKWSLAEAQAIFERVGLAGRFWSLPSGDRPF
jgi:alkylmercury lyase-like protein/DinB family protein